MNWRTTWSHDVRPMALVPWGRDYHNEIRKQAVIEEDSNEIRPSCILEDGAEVGTE